MTVGMAEHVVTLLHGVVQGERNLWVKQHCPSFLGIKREIRPHKPDPTEPEHEFVVPKVIIHYHFADGLDATLFSLVWG